MICCVHENCGVGQGKKRSTARCAVGMGMGKHESREPDTKPAVWVRSEPDMTRFYVGPGRFSTNKRAGLYRKLGTVG